MRFILALLLIICSLPSIAQQKKQEPLKPGSKEEAEFLDFAVRSAPPIHLRAKVPAGFIEIAQRYPCHIEEVVEKFPTALGGKHYQSTGDYLYVCAWMRGDKFVIQDYMGKVRILPIESMQPVKDGGVLFPK